MRASNKRRRTRRFCEPAAFCSQNKHTEMYGLQAEIEVLKKKKNAWLSEAVI